MDKMPLRSEPYQDIYFSAQGGLAEKRHVFLLGNDLPDRWITRESFTICEMGFGTGLSFLAAWSAFAQTARPGARLDYIGIEKHPLDVQTIAAAIDRWREEIGPPLWDAFLEFYPLRIPGFHRVLLPEGRDGIRASLTLVFDDAAMALEEIMAPEGVDAWFLDGFTPARNPAMWTPGIFMAMARRSAPGATLATFTAASAVRRGLEEAGFHVEKRPGFGFKRDMLTGLRAL